MIKPIAIHLPQFHPFRENDEWWGKGFTEWTNVTKAKPLFKGHYQPHLPADLGFYDLRLEEARLAQIALAKQYGIYGFCYYHYWFNGKRLMHEPLDRMLANKKEDFPFMLCWANENWTRRWDGQEHEILIKQEYSDDDDTKHIKFLCDTFFCDDRYLKINGKPFLVIYRPSLLPDIKTTISIWRSEAKKMGFEDLYIGYMQSFDFRVDPDEYGFDCAIEFHPNFYNLPNQEAPPLLEKLKNKLGFSTSPYYKNKIISYKKYVDKQVAEQSVKENSFPGIMPGWDNTARSKNGATIFKDSNPADYARWLSSIKEKYANKKDTYLFVNAWNEWAEGNHFEPCSKHGLKYLEFTKSVLDKND